MKNAAQKHGGARNGAGRKPVADDLRRVGASLRLRRSTLERMDRERAALGLSRGEFVEMLLLP